MVDDYLVNKTELQDFTTWLYRTLQLVCKIRENRLICGFCNNFFYPRKDGFQPIQWKVYFHWLYAIEHHFRIEIIL